MIGFKQVLRLRKRLILWVLVLAVPALACNFPTPTPTAAPADPVVNATLQGMVATLLATPPALTPALPPPEATAPPPFVGLATATPIILDAPAEPLPEPTLDPIYTYLAQSGDTLPALALRFRVDPSQITSPQPVPPVGLVPPGQPLAIPEGVPAPYSSAILPDSAVIFSPASVGFSTAEFVAAAGGYLSTYSEIVTGETLTGVQIIDRLAVETSTDPRLLLAFLEFRSGWVYGLPKSQRHYRYPIGFGVSGYTGLYKELSLATKSISQGYYGWRTGGLVDLKFQNGTVVPISPRLNAGTVGVQVLTAQFYSESDWVEAVYGGEGLLAVYQRMFGDPWERARQVEPLFPVGLTLPDLVLPFQPDLRWSLTAGPHTAWLTYSPRGALDFAPVTGERACSVSRASVTASASGLVVRSDRNVVAIDLDGDGYEQTGWVLVYLHLADQGRIQSGIYVERDEPIGHPSCEGGNATGTHVHFTRKYNGEWLAADGPLPFLLNGWIARQGERPYEGWLIRGNEVVSAQPGGNSSSSIFRDPN